MDQANQFRYEATPYRCFPCQARERASYQWSKDRPEGAAPEFGVYWAIHLDDDD